MIRNVLVNLKRTILERNFINGGGHDLFIELRSYFLEAFAASPCYAVKVFFLFFFSRGFFQ